MAIRPKRRDNTVRYKCTLCGRVTHDWFTYRPDWTPTCCGEMIVNPDDLEDVETGDWVDGRQELLFGFYGKGL